MSDSDSESDEELEELLFMSSESSPKWRIMSVSFSIRLRSSRTRSYLADFQNLLKHNDVITTINEHIDSQKPETGRVPDFGVNRFQMNMPE